MGLNEKKNRIFVFFILLLGGMLIFINLSNMYLWQDEASVAFLGRNVLKFGYPLIYDGKNVATNSPIDRLDYDYKHAYINTQTWLEYYVVAFSFLLFGVNTFAARFPFALFGLGTIIISYLLFLKINSNKTIARISVILLIFSVPFLLHVRQVNYYALSIFFSVWIFYAYVKLLRQEKNALTQFVISNVLLFYSFFVLTFLILFAIAIHFILFGYYKQKDIRKPALKSLFLIAILIFPSLFFFNPFYRLKVGQSQNFSEIFLKLKTNILWMNNYIFPFILLLLLGIKTVFRSERQVSKKIILSVFFLCGYLSLFYLLLVPVMNLINIVAAIILLFIISFIIKSLKNWKNFSASASYIALFCIFIIIVFTSTSISSDAPFFRYLIPIIPVFILMIGEIINDLSLRNNFIISLLLIMIISNNFLSVLPITLINNLTKNNKFIVRDFSEGFYYDLSHDKLKYDFFNYLFELTHEYDCPVKGIVIYLKKHASSQDVVKISYNDIPLMFYTDLRVMSWRQIGGNAPDWIIPVDSVPLLIDNDFLKSIEGVKYETIVIDYPNICYSNLPEPIYHNFRTVKKYAMPIYFNFNEIKEVPRVILYHKIK